MSPFARKNPTVGVGKTWKEHAYLKPNAGNSRRHLLQEPHVNGLVYGKIYRIPPYLMVQTMVSGRFSLNQSNDRAQPRQVLHGFGCGCTNAAAWQTALQRRWDPGLKAGTMGRPRPSDSGTPCDVLRLSHSSQYTPRISSNTPDLKLRAIISRKKSPWGGPQDIQSHLGFLYL